MMVDTMVVMKAKMMGMMMVVMMGVMMVDLLVAAKAD